MPRHTDNPSEVAWKDFAPIQGDGSVPFVDRRKSTDRRKPAAPKRGGCRYCPSRKFLRTSLRGADIPAILLLHYPVRCLRCRQRQFTDFLSASMALTAGNYLVNGPKKRGDWRSWTSGSDRAAIEAWERINTNPSDDLRPNNR